jgi:sulfate transport system permease protein
VVALGYLAVLLLIPVGLVLYRTFEPGLGAVWDSVTTPAAIHAFWLTLTITAIAVPINTVLGIITALVLVRGRFRGKPVVEAIIDLPFAISPVVVGLALIFVYGRSGWFGSELADAGVQVIFSLPGMVLATIFVSLPLVVRAIVPVLEELGEDQELAAHTLGASRWQTFRRITVPGIRGALGYGVVLCLARALGEYGAVAVVSGRLVGQTQTATLFVEERYQNYDQAAAFATATVLALIAIASLLLTRLFRPKETG